MKISLRLLAIIAASAIIAVSATRCGVTEYSDGTSPAEFTVASYNLRYANAADSAAGNGWRQRVPVIADLIKFHRFDIFGTQEGLHHQLDTLRAYLPGYDYTGVGRDDGAAAGEHSAIFWRTDMFTLLDHGDFWLSETPDTVSIGWDAALPRICSWGLFRHNESGQEFMFFNLHMDHIGKLARLNSASLVRERIDSLANGRKAFVTGDFNVDQRSASYAALTTDSILRDCYEVADLRYAPNGTFNDYSTSGFTPSRIDHVFVTSGIRVDSYGVLTDTYRTPLPDTQPRTTAEAPDEVEIIESVSRTPSDHFPVAVRVALLP